jgi:hypothetical protein
MATRRSAEAYGIDGGVLAVGKVADIVLADKNHHVMFPGHHAAADLVYGGGGRAVKTTICDGRVLMENGVNFNVFHDGTQLQRPWKLDLVPMAFDAAEWRSLETGLRQRARLIEAIVKDCYGSRHLVTDGGLPPEVLFANPGFLRSFCGLYNGTGPFITFYAAELARAPSGQWRVMADRADSPAGMAFALENPSSLGPGSNTARPASQKKADARSSRKLISAQSPKKGAAPTLTIAKAASASTSGTRPRPGKDPTESQASQPTRPSDSMLY